MKNLFYLLIVLTFILTSCQTDTVNNSVPKEDIGQSQIQINSSEHLSMATLWFQKSAESRALFYQTYTFAKQVFDKNLHNSKIKKPKAVITDIDETVLDNSPYEAQLMKKGESYNDSSWVIWVSEKRAKALPGAIEFFNHVYEKGVEVFYVSNRYDSGIEATMENLKTLGFPNVDKNHVLLKKESSDKTSRRNSIFEKYEVLLLLGDNLRDFDELFKDRKESFGFYSVDSKKNLFGDRYIIFPNPIYGEWEKVAYNGNYELSAEEKSHLRIEILDK